VPANLSTGLLTRDQVEFIHASALQVLEKIGVAVHAPSALKLLEDAGARVDRGTDVVSIPGSMVSEALVRVPRTIRLYDRDHENELTLQGDNVYYSPGSTTPFILDRSGTVRKPVSADLVKLVRLADALENIHVQSTALVVSDVADSIADLHRLFLVVKNSAKPIMTGAFNLEGLLDMKRILQIVAGGEEELANGPIAVFCACPTSPLKWTDFAVQTLTSCGASGIPVEIVSAPQLGTTGPATITGSLVELDAEFLSGLVISQLANPGAPVIYGGAPAAFDMRHCTPSSGAIEAMMTVAAYAEVAKHYGVPTSAYTGDTDAKSIDAQAGFESGLGIVLATLAGVNIVSGPGGMSFLNIQSLEKLVVDDAICGMAQRLKKGIIVNEETAAYDAIRKAGPGGHYLNLRHTLDWARKEQYIPRSVVDRQSIESWKAKGSRDSAGNAAEIVDRLLREHRPESLPSDTEKRLDDAMCEMMKRRGL